MIKWFRKLLHMVANYDNDKAKLNRLITMVRDNTSINVDVHSKTASHVIVIGRYKNNDFIQSYELSQSSFTDLVNQLKRMQHFGNVDVIDAHPDIKACIKRELE